MKRAIIAALLGILVNGSSRADDAATQVVIEGGVIQGSVSDGVLSFKGIPFAQPPVGKLRWRAPQPVKPWTGVLRAMEYGHDCAQEPFPSDAAPLGTKPAEDCLVLNVWRPANATNEKLPVMVWIYGGGFVNGGSSPAVYDGSEFAKRGIVLVSFNYRVGRFGFFAFPALTKENNDDGLVGNYAYMDQIAALKWVQRNIAVFGGAASNVTVFGESAGGGSVHMLLTSPMAKGLFAKAIVESGGGRGGLLPMRRVSEDAPGLPSAESIGVAFAKSVGIKGTDAKALASLRALPMEKVVQGLNMATMGQAQSTYVGGPMLDGKIVTEAPDAAYLARRQTKVPVMVGGNSADIGFSFAQTMEDLFKPFGSDAAKARTIYDPKKMNDVKMVGALVAMDRTMLEPARFVAATFARQNLKAYEYRFGYVAESMRAEWQGAPHATEIPFVFDTVAAKYGDKLTPKDESVAQAMIAYWSNFAKTGDPSGPGLPAWPAYDPKADKIIDFTTDGPRATKDPLRARLDLTEKAGNSTAPL